MSWFPASAAVGSVWARVGPVRLHTGPSEGKFPKGKETRGMGVWLG